MNVIKFDNWTIIITSTAGRLGQIMANAAAARPEGIFDKPWKA